MLPPNGNWNDAHEIQGRRLMDVLQSYLRELSPQFTGEPYEPVDADDDPHGRLLLAVCRLLCRRGKLRLEMQQAAALATPPGYAVQQVIGRWFDALTTEEKQSLAGLHFDLRPGGQAVDVTVVWQPGKEPKRAADHPTDAPGPDGRPGHLPDGEAAVARPA